MIDCIASYHLNPWTCGIAKFNMRLAQELGVPLVSAMGLEHVKYIHPLISVNFAEFSRADLKAFAWRPDADFFLHGPLLNGDLTPHTGRLLAANRELAEMTGGEEAFCPSTIPISQSGYAHPRFQGDWIRILTFGMAHKVDAARYRALSALLDRSGLPYTIQVSTALHEQTPWDSLLPELEAELRGIFNGKVEMLGYLSDAAMSQALTNATALAAFFPAGVRSNNTTAWAALEHGTPLITNLDEYSPRGLVHGTTCLDIDELGGWPSPATLRHLQTHGWMMAESYSWRVLRDLLV